MEAFYTIQGEGFYQGHAAYFIRLAGCNVGCVWCDVKESWDATRHPLTSIDDMASASAESGAPMVVITGGEPAMYNLRDLTDSIRSKGQRTHIETSGVYPLTGTWDWVCFSPKKFMRPHDSVYQVANELKVIIYHPSDLAWAQEHAVRVMDSAQLYLQPEWSREKVMLPHIIDFVKSNPRWAVSLQTHKYMNIP